MFAFFLLINRRANQENMKERLHLMEARIELMQEEYKD